MKGRDKSLEVVVVALAALVIGGAAVVGVVCRVLHWLARQ